MKRRDFLRGCAAASLIGVGVASAEHGQAQPEHVTLTFDESELDSWRPRLITRNLETQPAEQYAWMATSPEHETDAMCYWTFYHTQEGITSRDSHYLDREPVYVFVKDDEIQEAVWSAYHWLAGRAHSPSTDVDDHPLFEVAERYHHYYPSTDDTGVLEDLTDLNSVFDAWLDTGWEEDLHPGAAQNPWIMASVDSGASRGHWWKETEAPFIGKVGFSLEARKRQLYRSLGLFGAR